MIFPACPMEITWHSFHDHTEHTQSNGSIPIGITVSNTNFLIDVGENHLLSNTFFSKYTLINSAAEDIDSFYLGLFVDFELGCPDDWQPDCADTHLDYEPDDDVWQKSFVVPSGTYQYKVALNDSWDENYGADAEAGGTV